MGRRWNKRCGDTAPLDESLTCFGLNWGMPIFKVIVLAIVQGLAELLPVSSSAHVVVAEKLMGMNPSSPQMTLLLVMLHTGTMFAVIAYFWKTWKEIYFSSGEAFKRLLLVDLGHVADRNCRLWRSRRSSKRRCFAAQKRLRSSSYSATWS